MARSKQNPFTYRRPPILKRGVCAHSEKGGLCSPRHVCPSSGTTSPEAPRCHRTAPPSPSAHTPSRARGPRKRSAPRQGAECRRRLFVTWVSTRLRSLLVLVRLTAEAHESQPETRDLGAVLAESAGGDLCGCHSCGVGLANVWGPRIEKGGYTRAADVLESGAVWVLRSSRILYRAPRLTLCNLVYAQAACDLRGGVRGGGAGCSLHRGGGVRSGGICGGGVYYPGDEAGVH